MASFFSGKSPFSISSTFIRRISERRASALFLNDKTAAAETAASPAITKAVSTAAEILLDVFIKSIYKPKTEFAHYLNGWGERKPRYAILCVSIHFY